MDPITLTVLGVTALSAFGAEAGLKAYSSYEQGKEAERQAKAQAEIQRLQAQQQQMESEAYALQAADSERLANLEKQKAGIAQIQAEQEAEKRSRLLAADIGSAYANFAGNGLLVDGGKNDTFGSILTTTAAEAARDISTIKDNGRMNVWEHLSNVPSLMTTAATQRLSSESSAIGAKTSLLGAKASLKSGKYARRAGVTSAVGELIGATGGLLKTGMTLFG